MRYLLLGILAGASTFALSLGAGCGDDTGAGGESDEENPALADVVYAGGATDEALESLLDATATESATQGAGFTSPANGATVSAASSPSFTWAVGAKSGRLTPADHPVQIFSDPTKTQPRQCDDHPMIGLLQGFLAHERSAFAHGTPTSGPAYFVVFSASGNDKLLRVFTTDTSYAPDATALGKLKGAGTIHAVIENAEFDQNRIAQDGGPFTGPAIDFTVGE